MTLRCTNGTLEVEPLWRHSFSFLCSPIWIQINIKNNFLIGQILFNELTHNNDFIIYDISLCFNTF